MFVLDHITNVICEFCLPTIIGVFTFATPLVIQAISRVDDKYESTLLAKLFVKDRICKIFIWVGLFSFLAILFWILKLPRIIDIGAFNSWLDNSASLLLVLSTFALIVSTCGVLYLTSLLSGKSSGRLL